MVIFPRVFLQQDASSGTGSPRSPESALRQGLQRHQAQNLRAGIAIGSFGLIHSGTIQFLRQARRECDYLLVLILPQTDCQAPQLLRPEERLRLLNSLQEVDQSFLLGTSKQDLAECMQLARNLPWFCSKSERDIDADSLSALAKEGINIRQMSGDEGCSTRILLDRMARGKATSSR